MRRIGFFLICSTLAAAAQGADGYLDTVFGDAGWALTSFDVDGEPTHSDAMAVATDRYGRVYVAGTAGQDSRVAVTRLLPDGAIDPGHGGQGRVILGAADHMTYTTAAALQSDGKLVVAGSTWPVLSPYYGVFACRLTLEGTPDPTFGDGTINGCQAVDLGSTKFDTSPRMLIQQDGRIVIGTTYVNGDFGATRAALVRLKPSGEVDVSFGDGGLEVPGMEIVDPQGPESWLQDIAETRDGNLLVATRASFSQTDNKLHVYRVLGSDGELDKPNFGVQGKQAVVFQTVGQLLIPEYVRLTVLPGGGTVAAGRGRKLGQNWCVIAAQLTEDGAIDEANFGDGGIYVDGFCSSFAPWESVVQPDGKIVLAGMDSGYMAAMRLKADGTGRDPTFLGNGGYSMIGYEGGSVWSAGRALVLHGGRPVIAGVVGSGNDERFATIRLQNDLIFTDTLLDSP